MVLAYHFASKELARISTEALALPVLTWSWQPNVFVQCSTLACHRMVDTEHWVVHIGVLRADVKKTEREKAMYIGTDKHAQ